MVEFIIVAGILLASVTIISLFISVQRDHGNRVIRLVASEYP